KLALFEIGRVVFRLVHHSCGSFEILEQRVELSPGRLDAGIAARRIGVLEVEVRAKIRLFAVTNEGRLGLAALVVDVGIPEPAVLADVQIGPAMRAGIEPAYLDADLDVEDLLVAAGVAEVGHEHNLAAGQGSNNWRRAAQPTTIWPDRPRKIR